MAQGPRRRAHGKHKKSRGPSGGRTLQTENGLFRNRSASLCFIPCALRLVPCSIHLSICRLAERRRPDKIPHPDSFLCRGMSEVAFKFPAEQGGAFITNFNGCVDGIETILDHKYPCLLEVNFFMYCIGDVLVTALKLLWKDETLMLASSARVAISSLVLKLICIRFKTLAIWLKRPWRIASNRRTSPCSPHRIR